MPACLRLVIACCAVALLPALEPDGTGHRADHPVRIQMPGDGLLAAEWGSGDGQRFRVEFATAPGRPLLRSIAAAPAATAPMATLATDVDCRFRLTIGSRKQGLAWYHTFFDRVDLNQPAPVVHEARLTCTAVRVEDDGPCRVRIVFAGFAAGAFSGDLVVRIHDGSPFLQIQAAMGTMQPWCAYLYELRLHGPFTGIAWRDPLGKPVTRTTADLSAEPQALAVRHRLLTAGLPGGGALAVFPPPHAGFYPTDRSDNVAFVQAGRGVIGTRMDERQDTWRPWIEAPRGRIQVMDGFVLLTPGTPEQALERALRYTNGDVFKRLPGRHTLVEHFHAALTVARMQDGDHRRAEAFRAAMMAHGVDLVHLMEFHGDGHPADTGERRLRELKGMFDLCRDTALPDRFLFIPGEEYNAFSRPACHWAYLFPRPVYFQKAAHGDQPFVSQQEPYGTVYRVRNAEEMLRVLQGEQGLAWVSHPRIKSSATSPDDMLDGAWYRDPCWQAGDWKAMPADLSHDHLGFRSFALMDDTARWGFRRSMLGEVDTFRLDPSHEIYLHLNVNYLRLPAFPRTDDWSAVVDCVRRGDFFTTTGEVLIHDWSASASGVAADLEWYFPPAFARVVWDDGAGVQRRTLPLTAERELGRRRFTWDLDLTAARWVRFEAWDVARNGAFTQPHWLREPAMPAQVPTAITRFALVDADLGLPVPGHEDLADGAVLDRTALPPRWTIQAHTDPLVVGAVSVVIDDGAPAVLEAWPYAPGTARTWDKPSRAFLYRYAPLALAPGRHVLTVTPRSSGGQAGATRRLAINVR